MRTSKKLPNQNPAVVWYIPIFVTLVSLACGLPFQPADPTPAGFSTTAPNEAPTASPISIDTQPPALSEETVSPEATQIPAATPEGFPTVSPGVLKEQLYHASMYALWDEEFCREHLPAQAPELPMVVSEGRGNDFGQLEVLTFCIYGYPFDQETYISLYAPDGTFMGDGLLRVDSADVENGVRLKDDPTGEWIWVGDAEVINGIPTIRLVQWMPIGLPYGSWKMVLFAEGNSIEASFENVPPQDFTISTIPEGEIDLLPPYPCITYGPSDTVYFYGDGFGPNLALPLGVYVDEDFGTAVLVDSLTVSTGESGEFAAWVRVKDDYPEGFYNVIPLEALEDEVIMKVDATGCFLVEGTSSEIETTIQQPEGIWEPCPGSHVSRLHIGDHAIVNVESNIPNRVRTAPNRESEILGSLAPGETMFIIDGPECANDWVWWYVRAEDYDLKGWTTEGDHFEYWVEPLP